MVRLCRLATICVLVALCAHPAVATSARAKSLPLPLQPFTVELLDINRGRWSFDDALGQHLSLPGPVEALAFGPSSVNNVTLAYLCCDPEFPGNQTHAQLRNADRVADAGDSGQFRIREPYFSADASITLQRTGVVQCTLKDIHLGPATTGDKYVAGLYVIKHSIPYPVWLAADNAERGLTPRLLTNRIGNVFVGNEPIRVTLVASWTDDPSIRHFTLQAKELASGKVAPLPPVSLARAEGLARTDVILNIPRYGIHTIVATDERGLTTAIRVTRVPQPRKVNPDRSSIGINLFQQQIWWYAFQPSLMESAGVHWIRPWLAWENTWTVQEPEKGRLDTRALDSALRRMAACRERYQIILWGSPNWLPHSQEWPCVADMNSWSSYVSRLVAKYKGRIKYYEVWNEPDGMWPEKTRLGGEAYVAMLKSTFIAAKKADPGCVLLGLSHAGVEDWMRRVGAQGAGHWFDIATLHAYTRPADFHAALERRLNLLAESGMGSKPVWFNEFGSTAYDFSPAYSKTFGCSEMLQASDLPVYYAEVLAEGVQKAFWFCTYDPRDAAHESQWTGDAGIGVLYLGFLPKLSYAALANTAREMDGRRCLGRNDLSPWLHQVSFEGPLSLVWTSKADMQPISAVSIGCLPSEKIVLRDLCGNTVTQGPASGIKIDLSHGPLYVQGSRQMAAIARCDTAFRVDDTAVAIMPGSVKMVGYKAPRGAKIAATRSDLLPVQVDVLPNKLRLAVPANAPRESGWVSIRTTFPAGLLGLVAPHSTEKRLLVATGAPNLIRDGSFMQGDLREWGPERVSPFTWDGQTGRRSAGAMRLDGPFDRRMVHWDIKPTPGRALKLQCWVKTSHLEGCVATMNVAAWAGDKWVGTLCLAATAPLDRAQIGWQAIDQPGKIPSGTTDWTRVEATVASGGLPAGTTKLAFFIDVKDGTGTLWIDDLDLWQPESKSGGN